MNLCENGHDEVCFVGKDCPVCTELQSKQDVEVKLENKIEQLENEINTLNNVINRH